MAYVDDPNKQAQQANVAGSTPLSGGQPTQPSEGAETAATGSSTGGQIQSSGSSSPKPQIGAKGSGKASSGQYTNIQKYVAKNQPAAQQMAGAVTQDVGKQAESIRQAAQQKQQEQQKVLESNQQNLQQSQDWANQQLQNIMGQSPQAAQQVEVQGQAATEFQPAQYEISEADQARFQDLMKGNIAGVQDVGPLNIAKQQAQSQALQQMTGQAGTEAGRRQLLGQTFQKQGDYTRGMSGLDQLIVGGDQAAREALTQGVQQQGEQLGQGLQQMAGQSAEALAAQQRALKDATTGLGEQVTGLESGIQGEIDTAYEQALADRAALFDPESEAFQQAIAGASEQQAALQAALGGGEKGFASYLMDQLTSGNLQSKYGQDDWNMSQVNLLPYLAEQAGRLDEIGYGTARDAFSDKEYNYYTNPLTGKTERSYGGTGLDLSHHKERMYMRGLADDLQKQLGLGTESADLYGAGSIDASIADKGVTPLFEALQQQYQGIQGKTAEQLVQERLAKGTEAGTFEKLAAGEDISRLETATPEQVARINALKQLMGSEALISPEQYGEDTQGQFTQTDDLQSLLSRFGS